MSFIVTFELVSTIVPLVLPVLICAWNVSAPSVVVSAVGVTKKEPAFEFTVKLPLEVPKSPAFVTVQYSVVPFATFVVVTLNVKLLPSFTLFAAGDTLYVGVGA